MPEDSRAAEDGIDETTSLLHNNAAAVHGAILLEPPPDGGVEAWTQVLVGHLVNFNSFGYVASFGLFFEYYDLELHLNPSAVAWIGSVEVLIIFLVGTLAGPAADAGYFHVMLYIGLFLQLVAIFMTSISTQYWELFLFQGVFQGIGAGLLYLPALTVVSTYFTRNRTMALSTVACGGATGGMVFPAIARSLLYKIGFSWTVKVMGLVMLCNAIIAIILARTRLPPKELGPLIHWAAFKEIPYLLFTIGTFLNFIGMFFAYYYISTYSVVFLGASPKTSFNLLLTLNGAGLFGRLVPAYISDRYIGPMNTMTPASLISGGLIFAWIAVRSLPEIYVLVALMGFFLAAVQSLFPAAAISFAHKVDEVGVRMGGTFFFVGFACLGGPPIAGALVEAQKGRYLGAQIFGGATMVGGGVLLIAARLAETGWPRRRRA